MLSVWCSICVVSDNKNRLQWVTYLFRNIQDCELEWYKYFTMDGHEKCRKLLIYLLKSLYDVEHPFLFDFRLVCTLFYLVWRLLINRRCVDIKEPLFPPIGKPHQLKLTPASALLDTTLEYGILRNFFFNRSLLIHLAGLFDHLLFLPTQIGRASCRERV